MIHFSHDYEAGIKDERQRIIELLEGDEIWESGNLQKDLIALVKEEKSK